MLSGIGFYIWKIANCEGGNVDAIVKMAVESHFSHVLIKIADGTYSYNAATVQALTTALKAAGLQVWGWQYVYGANPAGEALRVIPIIQALDLDGFVVNAEVEYKRVDGASRAKLYMQTLRAGVGQDFSIALSTYRWPTYHPEFPFNAFLEYCDLSMPQVYWMQAHNPTSQLQRTAKEYAELEVKRPVFPTGACFREWGWQPTAVDVAAFIQAAKDLGLAGCNFWEWANARYNVPDGWKAISTATWVTVPAPLPEGVPAGYEMTVSVETLNLRAGPNTTFPDIGDLHKGEKFIVTGIAGSNAWAFGHTEDGREGWAAVQINSTRYMV